MKGGGKMAEDTVTVVENRKLREAVREITMGCFLTKSEYTTILQIIYEAALRNSSETA